MRSEEIESPRKESTRGRDIEVKEEEKKRVGERRVKG